jgi:hypothetical protein
VKIPLLAIVLLLVLDVALYSGLRQRAREKADLERRREELAARRESRIGMGEKGRRIQALLRAGSEAIDRSRRSLDIAEMRDLLLGAEQGLAIDRFSLDFRPEKGAAKGMEGGRVGAGLGGSFPAIFAYLARVENLRLPLAPSTLSMRREDFGRVVLSVEWNGLWGQPSSTLEDLSTEDIERMESWLRRDTALPPARNPFSLGVVSNEAAAPPPASVTHAPPPPPEELKPAPPKLTGFVIARAELEADVSRRVLAAIRFEERLLLVGLGETVGSYRLEEIDARESVLLVHEETGERLRLVLE